MIELKIVIVPLVRMLSEQEQRIGIVDEYKSGQFSASSQMFLNELQDALNNGYTVFWSGNVTNSAGAFASFILQKVTP